LGLSYYTGGGGRRKRSSQSTVESRQSQEKERINTEGAERTEYTEKKRKKNAGVRESVHGTGIRNWPEEEMESGMKRRNGKGQGLGSKLPGKPVSASRSEMTEIVLPAQTNPLGKLLGGQVMHLVDMAAAMAAHRHSNSYVVTASVDYIDFRSSVNLGEIVMLHSQVNRVFHTSMEVGVEVYSENVLTGEHKHTTTAYVTFVAIDEHTKKPKAVPPLFLKTAAERRRFREAAGRRKTRLALRYGK
jgi:acyl-CoA hydrolase